MSILGLGCASQTRQLLGALEEMIRQHDAGAIDYVIPCTSFSGEHARIAQHINELVNAHIAVKMKVVDIATQYSQGNLSVDMDRLPGQKGKITQAMDNIKHSLSNNFRTSSALDVTATNVMIADADYNIVYVNHSLAEMLVSAESDLRKDLPAFSARSVVGSNIDVFHKNPAYQRGMLAKLNGTHRTRLQVGGRKFDLIVNPITDKNGTRLGTVVEWKDVTAEILARERELTVASENLRIKNALDKCTTNVMIADADNKIVYMNDSVTQMLAQNEAGIRKVLPQFDARRLIGANMDTFHRNPAHQQNMVANLRGSYRTEIKVGGLSFGLIASPIIDEKGQRAGTVVEWKDRTQEVAVEHEVANIVSAASKGDFTKRVAMESKEGFFKQLAEGINSLLETSSVGLNEVVRMLSALARGDLTERISAE